MKHQHASKTKIKYISMRKEFTRSNTYPKQKQHAAFSPQIKLHYPSALKNIVNAQSPSKLISFYSPLKAEKLCLRQQNLALVLEALFLRLIF